MADGNTEAPVVLDVAVHNVGGVEVRSLSSLCIICCKQNLLCMIPEMRCSEWVSLHLNADSDLAQPH